MIKGSFLDNQVVGADDLNGLVKLFVGGGVADSFSDGVAYNVSKLNDVYYANLSEGVVPSTDMSLLVSVSNGRAWVAPGTAIFPDGTYAVITEVSTNVWESVAYTAGINQYIYLKSDRVNNCITLCVSESEPTASDNAVSLAFIAADGTVTDLRKYAKGKAPSMYAADTGLAGRRSFTLTNDTESISFSTNGTAYKYMFCLGKSEKTSNLVSIACIDLSSLNALSASNRSDSTDNTHNKFYVRTDGTFILAYNDNGGLTFYLFGKLNVSGNTFSITTTKELPGGGDSYFDTFIYPVELEIFLI